MIKPRSRYATTPIRAYELPDGQRVKLLAPRETSPTVGYLRAVVEPDQRLDHLATDYYGDPTEFWRICDASSSLDPFDVLVVGQTVLIPPAP